jgi:Domain of unknown function (DUF6371)
MNTEHRYRLEKGSKKHFCPDCGKRRFVRYIDVHTGNYLPEQYGRCDKGDGHYFLNPYLDGYTKMIWEQEQKVTEVTIPKQKYFYTKQKSQPAPEPVFFDFETFKKTLEPESYEKNIFIQNLFCKVKFPFEVDDITKVIQLYRLGTVVNGYRAGANTFPFIDIDNNVRAIQVKQFDNNNHTTGTDFLHSIIEKYHTQNNKPLPEWLEMYMKQDKKISCLFGEHLLSKYKSNPVALVEAPKTAVYCTLYFGLPETPESLVWLAVGAKGYLNFEKAKVLQGRFVYVFPDLSKDGNTFKEWETKTKEYENRLPGTRFIFSDLLEQLAPEQDKSEGNDIADYLIKQDWRLFRKRNIQEPPPQPEPEKVTEVTKVTHQQNILFSNPTVLIKENEFKTKQIEQTIQDWSNDISDLEAYFASIEIPTQTVKLNSSTINNCSPFIESHITTVKANNGKLYFLPYLNRLKELKELLSKQANQKNNNFLIS